MRFRVLKDILTPLHIFAPGLEIGADELDGPVSAERWVELGYLEPIGEDGPASVTSAAPMPLMYDDDDADRLEE